MFYNEHNPPHIQYQEYEAVVEINSGKIKVSFLEEL